MINARLTHVVPQKIYIWTIYKHLVIDKNEIIHFSKVSILYEKTTNFSFKGTYTCIAKGSKGSVEAETKVDVTGDDDPDNHGKGRDDLDWIDADEEDDYNLWWDPDAG